MGYSSTNAPSNNRDVYRSKKAVIASAIDDKDFACLAERDRAKHDTKTNDRGVETQ
jgi:hypothetical protein